MSHQQQGDAISLDALLRIDVRAEIRKLSDAQLQGSWQLGAECVRLATQCKANGIKIKTSRRSFAMAASNALLRSELLGALARVLDETLPAQKRHKALEVLESSDHPVLLVLLSRSIEHIDFTIQHAQGQHRLVWTRGQKPARMRQRKAQSLCSMTLKLRIRGLDRGALRSSLFELCRFCGVPLRVDGQPVLASAKSRSSKGNPVADLAQRRVLEPFPGTLTLPHPSSGSRVWLLQNGVIRANLSLPDRPWFVATLELSSKVQADATPADLRRRFEQELTPLVNTSIELLRAQVANNQDPSQLPALRHWVLEAAKIPALLPQVETLAVFEVHVPRKAPVFCSLADLAEDLVGTLSSQRPVRPRPAMIDPQDLARRAHHDTPLIAIETRAQPLLYELLAHRYDAAPALSRPRWWSIRRLLGALVFRRRVGGGWLSAWGRTHTRVLGLLGKKVPAQSLEPAMRRALSEIQALAGPRRRVKVCKKGRRPAWLGKTLLLPLNCPELRHWCSLDERQGKAKELLWSSLGALRRPSR